MRLWKLGVILVAGYGIVNYTPALDILNSKFLEIQGKIQEHDQRSKQKGDNIRDVFGR